MKRQSVAYLPASNVYSPPVPLLRGKLENTLSTDVVRFHSVMLLKLLLVIESKGVPKERVGRLRAEALWNFLNKDSSSSDATSSTAAAISTSSDSALTAATVSTNSKNRKRLFEPDPNLERIWQASVYLRSDNLQKFESLGLSAQERELARHSFHAGFFCVDKSLRQRLP
jgi:hypothetical protein